MRYISPWVDAVKLNFVKDIEVWIKNTKQSKAEYTTYDKYTLKIEYSYIINSLTLLIAYDGILKVETQSINTFNIRKCDNSIHFEKDGVSLYFIVTAVIVDENDLDFIKQEFSKVANQFKRLRNRLDYF